jgi:hypothetical protein
MRVPVIQPDSLCTSSTLLILHAVIAPAADGTTTGCAAAVQQVSRRFVVVLANQARLCYVMDIWRCMHSKPGRRSGGRKVIERPLPYGLRCYRAPLRRPPERAQPRFAGAMAQGMPDASPARDSCLPCKLVKIVRRAGVDVQCASASVRAGPAALLVASSELSRLRCTGLLCWRQFRK